ncbi:MAG: BBP7 family outer membrane beta-barrel protein [Planctomycetaceae bacterium]
MALAVTLAALLAAPLGAVEPLPPVEDPPPVMYLPDPQATDGFVGLPAVVVPDMQPAWPRWFAGASGLVMTRTLPSGAATMIPLPGGLQLTTADAGATWPGGVELRFGRWLGARQQQAVELIYWGIYDLGSAASLASTPPVIEAIPQAAGVTVGGVPAAAWLRDASLQQVGRSDIVNDVEVNWVFAVGPRPEFAPRLERVHFAWLAGFRFFQVGDTLTAVTTAANPANGAALLEVATNNNLFGGQLGGRFDWRFADHWRLQALPKVAIAGNALTNTTSLTGPGGAPATFAGGVPVHVHATGSAFSWLGSLDATLVWDVTDRWSLSVGYRLVGVDNIAQADGQWPVVLVDPASLTSIDAGSSTLVHGGFAGFESRF